MEQKKMEELEAITDDEIAFIDRAFQKDDLLILFL